MNRTSHELVTAVVLENSELECTVWSGTGTEIVPFASFFPADRMKRVSPGHLIAYATSAEGLKVVVWRWYDAVVVGQVDDETIRIWEPGHGYVLAKRRFVEQHNRPGSRVYASSGLPGADWWVAGATAYPEPASVEIEDVRALLTRNGLWERAFQRPE